MNAGQAPDEAVARPDQAAPDDNPDAAVAVLANRAWEIDRTELLCRSEHRAWQVAVAGMALGLAGVAAVLVQGPLRRVVEIPIVVDKVTGETTIQQRLAEENVPRMDTMDKHNLMSTLSTQPRPPIMAPTLLLPTVSAEPCNALHHSLLSLSFCVVVAVGQVIFAPSGLVVT